MEYEPVKDGVEKSVQSVSYIEAQAPSALSELVQCFWELKTEAELSEDFTLHALPDACVNLLFDQQDLRIADVTALQTTHTTLNLGRSFHYVGVQLYPGVWRDTDNTVDHYVGEPYDGDLPLVETNHRLAQHGFEEMAPAFTELVEGLADAGLIVANPITAAILTNLDDIYTVKDMANFAALSPRQLQRKLKAETGFAPHDLLKVLRLQRSFREDYLLSFTDQSHFTHSFKELTGSLVKLDHAKPGVGGTTIYFNCEDCSVEQSRVEAAGGSVVRPNFQIGEHGFVALAMDTEGNMIGFHSPK